MGVPPDELPVDADVDLHQEAQRREAERPLAVLATIGAGGALGSAGRYGLVVAFPAEPPGFPWTIFAVNVAGCLLIGALMVLVVDDVPRASREHRREEQARSGSCPANGERPRRRLARLLLGVGFLGGFTTFSTYAVQIQGLVVARAFGTAAAYLVGTLVGAVLATWAGLGLTRSALRWRAKR